ncbi:MAG: alkaline phosphatase family protein [Myxococcales bacterium]|nr:alkaline phosphatase family protein [Myxococcales bacterium]
MHVLRRVAAFLLLAPPLSLLANAGATYGAPPVTTIASREPHTFSAWVGPSERASADRTESAVVLVVLDGVRWQEIFGGADRALARQHGLNPAPWATPRALLPNLQRMLDDGGVAIGAPGAGEITTAGPQRISLPSYREIFTGRADTECQTNECARPPGRTVADDVYDASGPGEVAVVASWPTIARAASARPSRFLLTTGRKLVAQSDVLRTDEEMAALLDAGQRSAPFPGEGDYRPDAITSAIALRCLLTQRPRFLFVGLGDPDEYGHRNDYRGYLEALHGADRFLGSLSAALESMGARGRHTTVLVTTDHGRAYDFRDHGTWYPESGRVWLVASGSGLRAPGAAPVTSRKHTLAEVAPTVRTLLGLPRADGEPIDEIVSR